MTNMNNKCCCNNCNKCDKCDKEHDWNNRREECNIKSECCKQQFSLRATAVYDGTEVYRTDLNVTGTVILTNLGQRDIIFVVDGLQEIVPPNGMAALTAYDIDHVTISTEEEEYTSRALLCFDIQVPTRMQKKE